MFITYWKHRLADENPRWVSKREPLSTVKFMMRGNTGSWPGVLTENSVCQVQGRILSNVLAASCPCPLCGHLWHRASLWLERCVWFSSTVWESLPIDSMVPSVNPRYVPGRCLYFHPVGNTLDLLWKQARPKDLLDCFLNASSKVNKQMHNTKKCLLLIEIIIEITIKIKMHNPQKGHII